MRKQLLEIQEAERYLLHEMSMADRLVFQARMIISPELREHVKQQKKTLQIIKQLAREQKRAELEGIYTKLMADKHFAAQLRNIFK